LTDTKPYGYSHPVELALKAIAEPRRQEILRLVWNQERPAGEIATHFDVSRPAISKHLRVLTDAGLLEHRRNGTQRLYRARPEPLMEMRQFLESFWDEGLLAIKQAAESQSKPRGRP
jgi:DNA-binding transcriptional ArsR family regulator